MEKYHKYVFDTPNRKFVGQFEEMYQAETWEGFDSWHQEDTRKIWLRICEEILADYSFNRILDIGCGKGTFTHRLKKENNEVIGLDLSATAVKTASERYPDIIFQEGDIRKIQCLNHISAEKRIDLSLCLDILSYIENWPELLHKIAELSEYLLINLYIPNNPIGYVKSFECLTREFENRYQVLEEVRLVRRNIIILFGKSRLNKEL